MPACTWLAMCWWQPQYFELTLKFARSKMVAPKWSEFGCAALPHPQIAFAALLCLLLCLCVLLCCVCVCASVLCVPLRCTLLGGVCAPSGFHALLCFKCACLWCVCARCVACAAVMCLPTVFHVPAVMCLPAVFYVPLCCACYFCVSSACGDVCACSVSCCRRVIHRFH